MPLFRLPFMRQGRAGPRDLEVSMVGLKLGATVLQLGGRDPLLIAQLAKVAGISGTAIAVVESSGEADAVRHAAEQAGVLIDVRTATLTALPCDPESVDIAVAPSLLGVLRMNQRVLCLQQVLRVLRPGGRIIVIEPAPRGGLGAVLSQRSFDRTYIMNGGAEGALDAEGFRAVRVLAEREGKQFVEAVRPADAVVAAAPPPGYQER